MFRTFHRTLEAFRFLWKFVVKEIRWLIVGSCLTASLSLLFWLGPRVIGWIIDNAIIPHHQTKLIQGVLALLCIEVGRHLLNYFSQISYVRLGQNVIERVRDHMIQHILKLPISYLDKVSSGRMMTRIVSDVNSLADFFQSGLVSVLGNMANVSAAFLGLCTLHFKLGMTLSLAFFPVLFACAFFSKRLKFAYENSRDQLSKLNSMLADFLFGMKTIRSLGLNKPKFQELNRQINQYALAQMGAVKIYALFQPTLSLGIGVLLLIHIVFGLPLIQSADLKVGDWIAGLSYIMLLHGPLVEIADRWNFFLLGLTSVDRIIDSVSVQAQSHGHKIPDQFESLEFRNLDFGYGESSKLNALASVKFKINRGDWVGVFGESGSGKSTLLQLIFAFYPPTKGDVLWNGVSYFHLDTRALTRRLGVVEQFPFLFSGTVMDNLSLFGSQTVDIEALKKELAAYSLIQSILSDPNLMLHERGANISMGQKQMIAFLRAYIARPEIWILDEATAFFDAEAEKEVMGILYKLNSEKPISVIQVAHRADALSKMNRWLQMKAGHLQEVSREELLTLNSQATSSDPSG